MGMGRPRQAGQKDLPPGLYVYDDRDSFIKLKGMKHQLTLDGVRDREEAIKLYWKFVYRWEAAQQAKQAEQLQEKIEAVADGADPAITVAAYTKTWREKHLPKLVTKKGRVISKKTLGDYERMLRLQVEPNEHFQKLGLAGAGKTHVRRFLGKWISNPRHYNNFKSLLARMFSDAIAEGLCEDNPTADIERRPVAGRDVYVPSGMHGCSPVCGRSMV